MDVLRATALVIALVTLTCWSGAVAQESRFTCQDFITQTAAQAYLDQYPSDPYGLDPDGNGMACDEPGAQVASDREIAEVARLPLDARLGGTREQWEAEFGPPVEQDGEHAELFTAYDIPDLGTVYADEHLGHIESITVFAPRPEGEEWTDDPHAMNWTVAAAQEIAHDFLPRDARIDETLDEGTDFVHALCTSDALAAEVPPEVYDYVDNTPQYGRCSYALFYENFGLGDRISWISIDLAIEEPLVADVSAVATEPDTSDQILESPNITADEQAYFAQVSPLLTTMSDSIDRFSALINDPQVGDTIWTINVVTELAIWDESYEHVSELTPPPSLTALHSQVVEAFRLYREAGNDFILGADSADMELINQAASNITLAGEHINRANDLLEEFKRERGQ